MEKVEILNRVDAVCKALDNISVMGIQNAGNLAGGYAILNEIRIALQDEAKQNEGEKKTE